MTAFYGTKRIGHRGKSSVLYIPKDWDITPDKEVILLVWGGGEKIPDAPFKMKVRPKKMNSDGAIGIYFTSIMDMLPETDYVSFCVMTCEEEDVDA